MNAVSSVHAMGVRVSGRIAEEHVDTLREVIGWEKGRAALDLTEVMSARPRNLGCLRSAVSEAHGVALRNCPAYIREWVSRERMSL
jgi:hypothetical protein